MSLQGIVQELISSFGLKRKLSNLFQTLALVISVTPGISQYAPLLSAIANWLGLGAIIHATAARTLKVDIHTVAAFFSALILVAQNVPVLAPYVGAIKILASILSAVASMGWLVSKTIG